MTTSARYVHPVPDTIKSAFEQMEQNRNGDGMESKSRAGKSEKRGLSQQCSQQR